MKAIRNTAWMTASALILVAAAASAAQEESVGRGWPISGAEAPIVGAGGRGGVDSAGRVHTVNNSFAPASTHVFAAQGGDVPEGIVPLERDIFTSDDFYADSDLWSDPRYFRCNSPIAIEAMWGAYGETETGDNFPETVSWGHCDRDYPREDIVSPYPFETAQEHYEALRAETEARGGPTEHTMATVPDWTGRYLFEYEEYPFWFHGEINQVPTILSLLTPEYQLRAVQEAYHQANTNAAQWPASYCWPEGLMRSYWFHGRYEFITNNQIVHMRNSLGHNFMRDIMIGREFNMEGAVPRLGADVPRWFGETIGFWDEDVLVSWTSNVQGWTSHGMFEFSNQLQVIDIFTPRYAEDGTFEGVMNEAIFYDPEVFVEPLRMHRPLIKGADLTEEHVTPYIFVDCNQTIFPIDGIATPTTPGQVIEFTVPDRFNRPWAAVWQQYHEEGMTPPEQAGGLFGF